MDTAADTDEITLPMAVAGLCRARAAIQRHFAHTGLTFTLDGKLVGDIGEALVADAFGIVLCHVRTRGVDGHAPDNRTVQIKASGRAKSGPAFTPGEGIADHLIFLQIDFERGKAAVIYNGPEAPIRALLPDTWHGTKIIPLSQVVAADRAVGLGQRLPRRR